jgi:hypothetical protein
VTRGECENGGGPASLALLTLALVTFGVAVSNVTLTGTADAVTVITGPLAVLALLLGAWQLFRKATPRKRQRAANLLANGQ